MSSVLRPSFSDEAARSPCRSRGGGSPITFHGRLVLVDVDDIGDFA